MWERKDLRLELIGFNVGKLTITKFNGINLDGRSLWEAKCECGNTKIVVGKEFKRGKGGKKCDACHIEDKRQRAITHGETYSPLWNMWKTMKSRCDNKNRDGYKNYGGRGITYDSSWEQYKNFKKDMLDKYKYANRKFEKDSSLSLERIDVNKDYYKDNCCFIPLKQQAKNKRNTWNFWALSPEGKVYENIMNVPEFAREHNLSPNHIRECLREESNYHKGWEFRRIEKISKLTKYRLSKIQSKKNICGKCVWNFNAIAPNKRVYFNVKNAAKFAEKFELDPGHVKACLRKERKHHKGWTFKIIQSKRFKLKSR